MTTVYERISAKSHNRGAVSGPGSLLLAQSSALLDLFPSLS
jgi:hypothetical protein